MDDIKVEIKAVEKTKDDCVGCFFCDKASMAVGCTFIDYEYVEMFFGHAGLPHCNEGYIYKIKKVGK